MTVCLKIGVWLSIGLLLSPVAFGIGPEAVERLVLAKEGKTDYQIVISARTPKNIWDGQFLAWFLKEKTGATFPVAGARSYDAKKPAIFLGTSSALLAAVDPQPFAGMKDQDHVVRSHGRDIVLYGKGFDADFYAIVEFLDRCLGFRVYQKSVAPRIAKDEIVPDAYRLYHLGKVRPTQKCLVWFGYSWSTSYEPSLIWDPMDAMAKYDCWVSLKFPKDYAAGKDELVLCDQIILIKEP